MKKDKFVDHSDTINPSELNRNLKTKILGKNIKYFSEINSTNTYAKIIAEEGCYGGTLVIAETQTCGRGRLGREWNSFNNKGIWMSLVLRPTILIEDIQIITLAASVAVTLAIEKVLGIRPGIKWPNDIILDGKKVCGILTEMSTAGDEINHVILGMGINVNQEEFDFPLEIRNIATSLKIFLDKSQTDDFYSHYKEDNDQIILNSKINRSEIVREILFQMEKIYNKIESKDIQSVIAKWREYSVTLGKRVLVIHEGSKFCGIAKDITDDGNLMVESDEGNIIKILSGEVSVRGILGYT